MSTITEKVRDTLVKAGSCFRSDQIEAYQRAIEKEKNPQAKWTMEKILANAKAAKEQSSPLCDDTGIPHLILEVGEHQILTGEMLQEIYQGVQEGLRLLPGRPMAVKGDARARIEQSEGLYGDSAMLEPAPLMLKYTKEEFCNCWLSSRKDGEDTGVALLLEPSPDFTRWKTRRTK